MKYDIVTTSKFEKDVKLAKKQGKNLDDLFSVVEILANGKSLDERYKDHNLTGTYQGYRECHIKPDRLLIYKIEKDTLVLFLVRTGSHADLFE